MSQRSKSTELFTVGSGKRSYVVTINYDTGHFCTCRGMLSKKSTYGAGAGRTKGTCCKHIGNIVDSQFNGDWGTSTGEGNPRVRKEEHRPATPVNTGRRAAILAQRAKKGEAITSIAAPNKNSLLERIAALEVARS